MASNIIDMPAVLTMVNGYTPFTPDAGIFCGGYQGPLYPNPSTFFLPGLIFNTLPFQGMVASPYTMKNTGDVYDSGFGVGNPGINYLNPGHLLGIMDTFFRMSYGLGVIESARDASESFTADPSIDMTFPFLKFTDGTFDGGRNQVTISRLNLYPTYSEIPSNYLSAFVDDGTLALNPRTDEPFVFDGTKHQPSVSAIDLELLFRNVSTDSYYGLPEIFQGYFSNLYTSAQELETKVDIELTSDGPWGIDGTLISDLPNPIEDPDDFPTGDNDTVFAEDAGLFGEYGYSNQCKALSVADSLKLMTGLSVFHKPNDIQYEYRSLTELNSVVNVLPVQINGLKYYYTLDTAAFPRQSWTLAGGIVYTSYIICDVCFNTFQLDNIEISVDGDISTIDDITSTLNHRNVARQVKLITSVTNKFGWDRKWYGVEDNIQQDVQSQENFYISQTLNNGVPPDALVPFPLLTTSTDFDLTKTIEIGNGLHAVRARIIVKSKVLIDVGQPFFNGYEQLNLNLNITGENVNLSTSFVQL